MPNVDHDVLMTDRGIEEFTGGAIKAATLRTWRHRRNGEGPRWFRLGAKKIVYKRSDVVAWLEQQYAQTAADNIA